MTIYQTDLFSKTYNNALKQTFLVAGKYKNTENEKYIQFGLNIDGKKHFDAEVGLKIKQIKYGYSYQPKFYLGINNERIAELSG